MRSSVRTLTGANHPRFEARARRTNLLWLVLGLVLLSFTCRAALNPAWPPGKNFDLSHWHLTLPDSSATTIKPSTLTGGYTNANWFYTGSDGAMVFYCPVNGGTTTNSANPRSELRERIDPATTTSNWTYRGTHVLEAQCKILQAPSSGQLWIGQIHGYLSNGPALFLLRYDNGLLEAQLRTNPAVAGGIFLPLTNVALGELISYRIHFVEGVLNVSANGATQRIDVIEMNPGWTNQNFYFKAGAYPRDNEGPAAEGARVAFYDLRATHLPPPSAPSITLQPGDQVAFEGASALFTSRAQGTAPLWFQWQRDGTNLPSAASSNLTLSAVSSNDARQYTVVVTNVAGAVTSRVASLTILPAASSVLPPGSNFDLSHWYLTIPDATATIVTPAQLTAGFTNEWFFTGADGAMNFWCPVTGGTTANSIYPRSELREMLDPLDTVVNWSVFGTHVLDAQCRILKVPSNERLVIGQIHGYLGEAHALCLIKFSRGTIEAQIRMTPDADDYARFTLATNVFTNTVITYQIKLVDGLLTVKVNGASATVDLLAADTSWTNQSFYFKAGSYVQDNVGPNTEGSHVAFYQLHASHTHAAAAPLIAKDPVSQQTNAGATVNFRTLATGTPPLFFQWHKNGEPLSANTNSLLVLSNVVAADAALYHCAVTNSFGAVTSAVASLTLPAPPPPLLAIRLTGTNVVLTWRTNSGKSYEVFYKQNVADEWRPLTVPIVLEPGAARVEEEVQTSQRLYRVVEN